MRITDKPSAEGWKNLLNLANGGAKQKERATSSHRNDDSKSATLIVPAETKERRNSSASSWAELWNAANGDAMSKELPCRSDSDGLSRKSSEEEAFAELRRLVGNPRHRLSTFPSEWNIWSSQQDTEDSSDESEECRGAVNPDTADETEPPPNQKDRRQSRVTVLPNHRAGFDKAVASIQEDLEEEDGSSGTSSCAPDKQEVHLSKESEQVTSAVSNVNQAPEQQHMCSDDDEDEKAARSTPAPLDSDEEPFRESSSASILLGAYDEQKAPSVEEPLSAISEVHEATDVDIDKLDAHSDEEKTSDQVDIGRGPIVEAGKHNNSENITLQDSNEKYVKNRSGNSSLVSEERPDASSIKRGGVTFAVSDEVVEFRKKTFTFSASTSSSEVASSEQAQGLISSISGDIVEPPEVERDKHTSSDIKTTATQVYTCDPHDRLSDSMHDSGLDTRRDHQTLATDTIETGQEMTDNDPLQCVSVFLGTNDEILNHSIANSLVFDELLAQDEDDRVEVGSNLEEECSALSEVSVGASTDSCFYSEILENGVQVCVGQASSAPLSRRTSLSSPDKTSDVFSVYASADDTQHDISGGSFQTSPLDRSYELTSPAERGDIANEVSQFPPVRNSATSTETQGAQHEQKLSQSTDCTQDRHYEKEYIARLFTKVLSARSAPPFVETTHTEDDQSERLTEAELQQCIFDELGTSRAWDAASESEIPSFEMIHAESQPFEGACSSLLSSASCLEWPVLGFKRSAEVPALPPCSAQYTPSPLALHPPVNRHVVQNSAIKQSGAPPTSTSSTRDSSSIRHNNFELTIVNEDDVPVFRCPAELTNAPTDKVVHGSLAVVEANASGDHSFNVEEVCYRIVLLWSENFDLTLEAENAAKAGAAALIVAGWKNLAIEKAKPLALPIIAVSHLNGKQIASHAQDDASTWSGQLTALVASTHVDDSELPQSARASIEISVRRESVTLSSAHGDDFASENGSLQSDLTYVTSTTAPPKRKYVPASSVAAASSDVTLTPWPMPSMMPRMGTKSTIDPKPHPFKFLVGPPRSNSPPRQSVNTAAPGVMLVKRPISRPTTPEVRIPFPASLSAPCEIPRLISPPRMARARSTSISPGRQYDLVQSGMRSPTHSRSISPTRAMAVSNLTSSHGSVRTDGELLSSQKNVFLGRAPPSKGLVRVASLPQVSFPASNGILRMSSSPKESRTPASNGVVRMASSPQENTSIATSNALAVALTRPGIASVSSPSSMSGSFSAPTPFATPWATQSPRIAGPPRRSGLTSASSRSPSPQAPSEILSWIPAALGSNKGGASDHRSDLSASWQRCAYGPRRHRVERQMSEPLRAVETQVERQRSVPTLAHSKMSAQRAVRQNSEPTLTDSRRSRESRIITNIAHEKVFKKAPI